MRNKGTQFWSTDKNAKKKEGTPLHKRSQQLFTESSLRNTANLGTSAQKHKMKIYDDTPPHHSELLGYFTTLGPQLRTLHVKTSVLHGEDIIL